MKKEGVMRCKICKKILHSHLNKSGLCYYHKTQASKAKLNHLLLSNP